MFSFSRFTFILFFGVGVSLASSEAQAAPDLYLKSKSISISKNNRSLIGVYSQLVIDITVASTGGNVTTDFNVAVDVCKDKAAKTCYRNWLSGRTGSRPLIRDTITSGGRRYIWRYGMSNVIEAGAVFIRVALDINANVAESNESNNAYFHPVTINDKYELQVGGVGVNYRSRYPGEKMTVTFWAHHAGLRAPKARFGVYWSKDGKWDSRDELLGFLVREMREGSSFPFGKINLRVDVTIPKKPTFHGYGTGALLVVADDLKQYPEVNENNNVAAKSFVLSDDRADLRVSRLVLSPSVLSKNQTVTVQYSVSNIGRQLAGPSELQISDGLLINKSLPISKLAPGANFSSSFTLALKVASYGPSRTHQLVGLVDPKKRIAESNENNNRATFSFYTRAAYDYVLQNLKITPSVQTPGGKVSVSAEVVNKADFESGTYTLEFYYSKVRLDARTIGRDRRKTRFYSYKARAQYHKPQEKKVFTGSLTLPTNLAPGGLYIYGLISIVQETNYSNNFLRSSMTIATPKADLKIIQVVAKPTTIVAGKRVLISYTLENAGAKATGAFVVGAYLSKDATITTADTSLGTQNLRALSIGQRVSQGLSVLVPTTLAAGKVYLGIVADTKNQVVELSKANNAQAVQVSILADRDGDGVTSDKDCNDNDKTVYPGAKEICDNKDNNCNKQVDESVSRTCYTGSAGTAGKGVCKAGIQRCAAGRWGSCTNQVTPGPEICDGKDNDCDGKIDDGLRLTKACPSNGKQGLCAQGRRVCQSGRESCVYPTPKPERCDGLDNDCNGRTDEVAACQSNCYQKPCANGKFCIKGKCIDDPCRGVRCGTDEYCLLGQCIKRCACTCTKGSFCVGGKCIQDPCAQQTCGGTTVCSRAERGKCVQSRCPAKGCGAGRACVDGVCADDLCNFVKCGAGYRCEQGQCAKSTACRGESSVEHVAEARSENTTEVVREPVDEQIADLSRENTPEDAGSNDKTPDVGPSEQGNTEASGDLKAKEDSASEGATPDTMKSEAAVPEVQTQPEAKSDRTAPEPPSGGCQCTQQPKAPGFGHFLLCLLGLLAWRRSAVLRRDR